MSTEWFDLGQRLRAAATGRVQPRLTHAPVVPGTHPVAVRATLRREAVEVAAAAAGTPPATATGPAALDLLGSLGVSLTAPDPATLVTDHPTTPALLARLAASTPPGGPHEHVAAHLAWWHERADFPGASAAVDVLAACRARWVTGLDPARERTAATWRHWLAVTDPDLPGVLDLYAHVTAGVPLPPLAALAEDEAYSYGFAAREHAAGRDWRRPDTTARAALGLRSRCDAADLYAAALLADPLHRRRAVHSGHVVVGHAHPSAAANDRLRRYAVTCDRLDSRLRPGTEVTGWTGPPESTGPAFSATVSAAEADAARLVLHLSGLTGAAPSPGALVTLHPLAPSAHRQRSARRSYRELYAARRSWLTTGRAPAPSRREVPLDVLVAGADAD